MKGLVLSGLDRREEAHALAKQALRSRLDCTVAWHVYGLLHRADRNYEEAIKCYKNALRLDPAGQPQVLRDLAQLQIQTRDVAGFVDARAAILASQADAQHNWAALAVGYHLAGAHALALAVLDQWAPIAAQGVAARAPPPSQVPTPADAAAAQAAAYERSECALYAASIQAEAGQHEAALARLDALLAGDGGGGTASPAAVLKDVRGAKAARAAALGALGRAKEAEAAWRDLLDGRPADLTTHDGVRAARGLPACGVATRAALAPGVAGADGARSGLRSLYADLIAAHPSIPALRRCVLDYEAAGPSFTAAADAYARFLLTRCAPSLFSDLAPLYPGGRARPGGGASAPGDVSKAVDLGALFEAYEVGLRADGALPPPPPPPPGPAHPAFGPLPAPSLPAPLPVLLAGVCSLLGQHYARLGRTGDALAAFDRAEAALEGGEKEKEGGGVGAVLADVLSARARALAAAGDAPGAAAVAVAASSLDAGDRYLNSLASQALFASGDAPGGVAMASRFARDAEASGAGGLSEMQCVWFEAACGAAATAAGRAGPALKAFTATLKHYVDFGEDAFDFHGYCVRKCTLRAYVSLLRTGPALRDDPAFADAAVGAVRVYLGLDDAARAAGAAAEAAAAASAAAEADAGASPEERKRARQRAKKEAARAERAAAEKAAADAAAAAAEREATAKAAAAAAPAGAASPTPAKKAAAAKARKDLDPDGAALAATADPLGEASSLVALLALHAPSRPDTHTLCFEVAARRGKPLLMLRAARAAGAGLGPAHWAARSLAVRCLAQAPPLAQGAPPARPPAQPAVRAVLDEGLAELRGSAADAAALAAQVKAAALASRDPAAIVASFTDAVDVLGADRSKAAMDLVGALPDPDPAADADGAHGAAVEVEVLLAKWEGGPGGPAASAWRKRCAFVFQWSAHFGGAKRVTSDGMEKAANGVAGLSLAVA